MFYTRFLSPTDQKCAESSMYWQFLYYRPPGSFWYTAGDHYMWCQELYIFLYIDITLSIINIFSISSTGDCTTFSQFIFNVEKKKVFKIFKSWHVRDWLAKWLIMLGFMDLRRPRVSRRSNVGHVLYLKPSAKFHYNLIFSKILCPSLLFIV